MPNKNSSNTSPSANGEAAYTNQQVSNNDSSITSRAIGQAQAVIESAKQYPVIGSAINKVQPVVEQLTAAAQPVIGKVPSIQQVHSYVE
jgi:hypothetical protein